MENELWLHKGKKFQRSGPDGLEAWKVAIAASLINFIMAGINRASGILYVEFLDAFHTDRMQASLPLTIRSLSRNLLSPVVGIFGQKYGVRPVILAGAVLESFSAAACFFASDIFWISFFWGCCNGLGAAMIMILVQAAITEHFDKHISTASGISLSGGCFGSFIFPAMLEYLIDEYGINGTFLFISGIMMHVIPAAITMKKPTWSQSLLKKEHEILVNGNINSNVTDIDTENKIVNKSENEVTKVDLLEKNNQISHEKSILNKKNKWFNENDISQKNIKKIDTDLLWAKKDIVIRLLTNDDSIKFPPLKVWQAVGFHEDMLIREVIEVFCKIAKVTYSDSLQSNAPVIFNLSTVNNNSEKNISADKDTLCVKETSNLLLTQSTECNLNPADCLRVLLEKFFERDKEEIISLFPQDTYEDLNNIFDEFKHIYILLENSTCSSYKCNNCSNLEPMVSVQNPAERSNTFWSHIKTAMWLHTKPLFLLTCLCRCVHFITFMPIMTTVVDFARDKGLPERYGKYAIGTLALGDLIGRLFSGWLTDKEYLSLPRYMFIFMILQGIFTISIALTNSTESLLIVLTVYGLLQGCTFIRHPVLISHYMGKDEQSIALGCLNFFPGVIGFAMPFYIGYFRDTVGAYDGIFYINGSIGAFIGFLWLTEPYLLKCYQHFPQRWQRIPV